MGIEFGWEMSAEDRARRDAEDADRKAATRARWNEAMAFAREHGRDYVACATVGVKTHAATSSIVANGGYTFPRPRCAMSASSTRAYAMVLDDQTTEITCKRCIVSLEKRAGDLARKGGG